MSKTPLPKTLTECHALIAQQQAVIERQHALIKQQQAVIEQQQASIEQQQATIDDQQSLLKALQKDVALLKRSLFGPRRERYENPDQRLLFDAMDVGESSEEDDDEDEPPPDDPDDIPSTSRRRGRGRRVIPECLPRIERFHKLEDHEIPDELCGQLGPAIL